METGKKGSKRTLAKGFRLTDDRAPAPVDVHRNANKKKEMASGKSKF